MWFCASGADGMNISICCYHQQFSEHQLQTENSLLIDRINNQLLNIYLATVRAERISNSPPAASRRR